MSIDTTNSDSGYQSWRNSRRTNGKTSTTTEESEKEITKKEKEAVEEKEEKTLKTSPCNGKSNKKIRQYLLKEEKSMAGIHVTKGAKILENSTRAERQRILTAYKDLFSTNCAADIGEAF